MAKKARAKSSVGSGTPRAAAAPSRDGIIDAMMGLLAGRGYASVGLADIAEKAGISLAELREVYDGKLAILADFARRIDRAVLDGGPAEGEMARDRIFDILMRRFDALAPHKAAMGHIIHALRGDPCLARAAHRIAARSLNWMFVGAGVDRSGVSGVIALEGLILLHIDVLRVWLDEDDPGLAKTMAALDHGLDRGERAMRLVDGVCVALRPFFCRDRATRGGAAAADA